MGTSKKLLKNGNLGNQAYKKFKELLFDRIWRPGDFVSQSELVEKTGFPIRPMRDALHKLSAEGFVIITPQKGSTGYSGQHKNNQGGFSIKNHSGKSSNSILYRKCT